jgi:hypothetical protein
MKDFLEIVEPKNPTPESKTALQCHGAILWRTVNHGHSVVFN